MFLHGRPNRVVNDYTEAGTLRSIEDSLTTRLGVDRIDIAIVVGGPYSSGVLVGGPNFEYAPATLEILAKVAAIKAIADAHGVSMKAAGLRFALANPAVAAVIPGASRPERIAEDTAAMAETVPLAFWRALREAGLVDPAAPLPDAE